MDALCSKVSPHKTFAMEKIYIKILGVSSLLIFSAPLLNAQCGIPIPSVSGNTLICGSSASFTLTATGSSSITTWFTSTAGAEPKRLFQKRSKRQY